MTCLNLIRNQFIKALEVGSVGLSSAVTAAEGPSQAPVWRNARMTSPISPARHISRFTMSDVFHVITFTGSPGGVEKPRGQKREIWCKEGLISIIL
jgi:hypothetical protein